MSKRRSHLRLAVLVTSVAMIAWIGGNQLFAGTNSDKQTAAASAPASPDANQKSGEQVFMENCSRCHKPPMVIPQRITGTIVMHMRVRAKLSRQDEQALLRYLAP